MSYSVLNSQPDYQEGWTAAQEGWPIQSRANSRAFIHGYFNFLRTERDLVKFGLMTENEMNHTRLKQRGY